MSPYVRKRLHEANLKRLLATLTPDFMAHDQYVQQIGESVKTRLDVDKQWRKQSHRHLSRELKNLFPDVRVDPDIEQTSLSLAQAIFACRRMQRQKRIRRQIVRKAKQVKNEVNAVAVMEPGSKLPAVTRQRQAQSDVGPSIITTLPRSVEPSMGTSFIASTYMERVLRYNEEKDIQRRPPEKDSPQTPESNLNLGRTRRRTRLSLATPPNSLFTATQSTSASTLRNHCHNNTPASDVNVPTPPATAADSESHSHVGDNDGGIREVKSFLETCRPSMVHHFDSFIEAGVKNAEYLKAVDRLCVSDPDALSSVLASSDLSRIDSILLRNNLHRWVEERSADNEVA